MHDTAMQFGQLFFQTYVKNSNKIKILDIGSQDVNGSLRTVAPSVCEYIGVDFEAANGVDVVLTDANVLPFDNDSIDVVVSSSCFEHAEFFWSMFIEIQRVLKPEGLFYLNAPSNGTYHRYPVDCWRFYPDSGVALSHWGQKNGYNTQLIESFVGYKQRDDWNDFVSVFVKDGIHAAKYTQRIIESTQEYTNAKSLDVNGNLLSSRVEWESEDQRIIKALRESANNRHKFTHKFEQNTANVADKWASYLDVYDEIFRVYQEQPLKLLEVGIQNGGSLDVYASYFENAELIAGVDINENCQKIEFDDSRIKVVIGDCTDEETYQSITALSHNFDIIIDDASHKSEDIIDTFIKFFPRLNDDGIYIVEDLCCSYWQDFEGGLNDEASSMAFFKSLVDVVNHEHWGNNIDVFELIAHKFPAVANSANQDFFSGISKIQFHNSMCIICKNMTHSNQGIGLRKVSGKQAVVVQAAKDGSEAIRSDESNSRFAQLPNFSRDFSIAKLDLNELLMSVCGTLSPICYEQPKYLSQMSAWKEHIPFAFQCVDMLKPHCIVELGTHFGDSYFAFCEAVDELKLNTHCYAVDTWMGDEHAGYYGSEVFDIVEHHNQENYKNFSTLIRSTFNEAINQFADQQIDLLHIDGMHNYDAVKEDFENWLPKMSKYGVILFHDTQVKERNFGVWKLWNEVCHHYPHFEFHHGYGLGVLGVGDELPIPMQNLFNAQPKEKSLYGGVFAILGGKVQLANNSDRSKYERYHHPVAEVRHKSTIKKLLKRIKAAFRH